MFSTYEQRCFIKIQVARCINARQYHTELLEACGKETLPYRTMARCVNAFRRRREDVHQKRGAGRPQSARDDVHVNAVRALLEEHHCWTCIKLTREVGVAPGTIFHLLKKKLKMRKICAPWVPQSYKGKYLRNAFPLLTTVRYGKVSLPQASNNSV
ncbi:hypothetical protein C0J52_12991 [Blattella germanica]|nr:hypothetical protein C0J52_12991 [Blattella germanica]